MLSVAIICALSQGLVTYDRPISTVQLALDEIAKQSGKQVEQIGIGHVPILIQAKGVEAKDLLERIAQATDSELSTTSTGYRLTRSAGRVQAAKNAEKAEIAVRLTSAIAKRKKEFEGATDWSSKAILDKANRFADRLERSMKEIKQFQDNQEQFTEVYVSTGTDSPAAGLIGKLLATEPVATWLPDTPEGIVRISDKPNRFQRRLNANMSRDYDQFAQAQNQMRSLVHTRFQLERTNVGLGTRDLGPGEVQRTIILANWQYRDWLSFTLYLLDRNNHVVGRSSLSLSLAPEAPKGTGEITSEKSVPVSKETQALVRSLKAASNQSQQNTSYQMSFEDTMISLGQSIRMTKQPEAVLERLSDSIDPFEEISGSALRSLAQEEGKSIVAVLPDSLFLPSLDLGVREKFALKDSGALLQRKDVKVIRTDGWIVVQPRLAVMNDRNVANRTALTTFCRELRAHGYASLEQCLAYAQSRGDRFTMESMDFLWIQAMNGPVSRQLIQDMPGLKLYAGLPSSVKSQTESTTEVKSGDILKVVGNRLDNHFGDSLVIGDGVAISRTSEERAKTSAAIDVSEPLAAGLVSLNVKHSSGSSLFVKRNGDSGGKFVRTKELGALRVLAAKTQYAEFTDELLPYDSFQKASNRRVEMQFTYAPSGYILRDDLDDNKVIPNSGPWTWNTLPPEIKNEILDAEKRYRQYAGGG